MATKLVNVDLDFNSAARPINLPEPTAGHHPATKTYVDSAVEGLAWKDSVRVATSSNINLASPGAALDGVTMAANDRFLAMGQTTQSQNGIYIWNGAATPATRAPDASTSAELEQAVVTVEEGTSAASTFRQTTVNFTLDSGNVVWTSFGISTPSATETTEGKAEIATQAETNTGTDDQRFVTPLKLKNSTHFAKGATALFGDGSAVSYVINHALNTLKVQVAVLLESTGDEIMVEWERTDANNVTIKTNTAPASNAYRAIVIGFA